MLCTEATVRANIRNRDGKRVYFLGASDRLTPGARDYLNRERIQILPAEQAKIEAYRLENGAVLKEKPEHMTHLRGNILVEKTHPRIAFRGALDTLEAELLLCQLTCSKETRRDLAEILALARMLIRCDVMEEPVPEGKLCGLTQQQIREHSHRPQDFYNQSHFMPEVGDGELVLRLNLCRCRAREAELAGARAFMRRDGNAHREDILRALNRMSSMLYILMIREKGGQ